MDERIRTFRATGKVYMWRYRDATAGYKGCHLTADRPGCQDILTLLNLMNNSQYSSTYNLKLTPPTAKQTDVPTTNYKKIDSFYNLKFKHQKQQVNLWQIDRKEGELIIEFGAIHLNQLRDAIKGIADGKGDIAITDESRADENMLWCWWNI